MRKVSVTRTLQATSSPGAASPHKPQGFRVWLKGRLLNCCVFIIPSPGFLLSTVFLKFAHMDMWNCSYSFLFVFLAENTNEEEEEVDFLCSANVLSRGFLFGFVFFNLGLLFSLTH